jgi:hypothetical protein
MREVVLVCEVAYVVGTVAFVCVTVVVLVDVIVGLVLYFDRERLVLYFDRQRSVLYFDQRRLVVDWDEKEVEQVNS